MEEILIKTNKKYEAVLLLRSAIDREIAFIKTSLLKTEKRLKNFQQKYKMNIDEAKERGINDMILVEWEGEAETRNKLKDKIEKLQSLKKCI